MKTDNKPEPKEVVLEEEAENFIEPLQLLVKHLTWYHNDTLLVNDQRTRYGSNIVGKQWEGFLERKNMSFADSGTYRCHPSTYHENLGYNVPVYVRGKSKSKTKTKLFMLVVACIESSTYYCFFILRSSPLSRLISNYMHRVLHSLILHESQ